MQRLSILQVLLYIDFKIVEKNNSKKESKILGIRLSALMEIFFFFLISYFIAYLFGLQYNYFDVSPHPYWIIVILISAQYGTLEGLLAAFFSTVFLLLGPLPKQNLFVEPSFYFFDIAKSPLLWFVTAVILGELRMKHIRERNRLREEVLKASEKESKIAEAYEALKKVKELLEMRVATEVKTTQMVMHAFHQLQMNDQEHILNGASELVKILLAPEKFSLFFLEAGKLKMTASFGWALDEDHYKENFDNETPLFQNIVVRKTVVSFPTSDVTILGKEGIIAVPIIASNTGQVFGMIKIESIPLSKVRTTSIETLRNIGEWVGEALFIFSSQDKK